MSEQFWDAEKNTLKVDDLIKSHGELSAFKAAEDQRLAKVPAKPDEYAIPEILADEEVAKLIPPGQEITLDPKDPLLGFAREYAHKHKFSNEQFGEMVQGYIKHQVMEEARFNEARAAEKVKLGATGPQREKALHDFLVGHGGEADAKVILSSVFSATQFEALERLAGKFSKQNSVLPASAKRDDGPAPQEPKPLMERLAESMYGTPQKAS